MTEWQALGSHGMDYSYCFCVYVTQIRRRTLENQLHFISVQTRQFGNRGLFFEHITAFKVTTATYTILSYTYNLSGGGGQVN
jgi:hypothetical protein